MPILGNLRQRLQSFDPLGGLQVPSAPGDDGGVADNPIMGTPFDPKRNLLKMADPNMGAGQPMDEQTPIGGDSVNMPSEPVSASAASSAPTLARAGESPELDLTQGSDPEDQMMQRVMRSMSMDDLPSQQRIHGLEDQYGAMRKKPGWKGILGRIALMAAPVVAGGLVDGTVGVSGAAEGVTDAEQMMHERGEHDQTVVRAELEAERQRQERQWERKLQLPVTMGNMMMMREYRKAMIEQKARGNDIGQQNANTRAANGANSARRTDLQYYGAGRDPKTGQPIDETQLTPQQRAKLGVDRATEGLRQAQDELARARASKVPYEIAIAERNTANAGQAHQLAAMAFARDTYGRDLDGNIIPGTPMETDDDGNQIPMGWKANAWIKPSGQSRSRGDQGSVIIQAGDDLVNYIKTNKGDVGDLGAIINRAFLGTPVADAKSAEMASRLASYAALQPALHGFRGQDALAEFTKIIGGLPKSPEALIAAINGIRPTAVTAAEFGKQKVYTGKAPMPGQTNTGASSKLSKSSSRSVKVKGTGMVIDVKPEDMQ